MGAKYNLVNILSCCEKKKTHSYMLLSHVAVLEAGAPDAASGQRTCPGSHRMERV